MNFEKHIYLQYAPVDYPLAVELNATFQEYGLPTWMDCEELSKGGKQQEERERIFENALAIASIVTKDGVEQGYSEFESNLIRSSEQSDFPISERIVACMFEKGLDNQLASISPNLRGKIIFEPDRLFDIKLCSSIFQEMYDKYISPYPDEDYLAHCSGNLFEPEELDIYVNKATKECFIFYGKEIPLSFKHIEYHHQEKRIAVVYQDGSILDLGVGIQWLIRPHIARAQEISVVQTKDGEAIKGHMVPLKHIGRTTSLFEPTQKPEIKSAHSLKSNQERLSEEAWIAEFK